MRRAVAAEVIKFLETKIFYQYGVPEFKNLDNGYKICVSNIWRANDPLRYSARKDWTLLHVLRATMAWTNQ